MLIDHVCVQVHMTVDVFSTFFTAQLLTNMLYVIVLLHSCFLFTFVATMLTVEMFLCVHFLFSCFASDLELFSILSVYLCNEMGLTPIFSLTFLRIYMLGFQIMSRAEYILGKQLFHHKFTKKKNYKL